MKKYLFMIMIFINCLKIHGMAPVERDMLRKIALTSGFCAAAAATRLADLYFSNQCMGQCGAYAAGTIFAAGVCVLSLNPLPNAEQIKDFLRESGRALACGLASRH